MILSGVEIDQLTTLEKFRRRIKARKGCATSFQAYLNVPFSNSNDLSI